jgi:3-hydroxymyristoyl/3-hydroxydecanoyl-(acyl carrier protein) dehydratase
MKFRFVDRIVSWQPRRSIRGAKTVSFEEYRLKAPFGDGRSLPETLLLEGLFQLGNWLAILSTDFRQMVLLVRIGRVAFDRTAGPGDTIDMAVSVRRWRDDGIAFDGSASVGGRTIATGVGCLGVPVELADYQDAEDLRVLYSQIHRPEEEAG